MHIKQVPGTVRYLPFVPIPGCRYFLVYNCLLKSPHNVHWNEMMKITLHFRDLLLLVFGFGVLLDLLSFQPVDGVCNGRRMNGTITLLEY